MTLDELPKNRHGIRILPDRPVTNIPIDHVCRHWRSYMVLEEEPIIDSHTGHQTGTRKVKVGVYKCVMCGMKKLETNK